MVHCRPRWVLGFTLLIAATAAGGLSAAGSSPEDTLKSHDLKRVGTTYVLPAESEVQRKTSALKILWGQLSLAIRRQQYNEREVEDQKGMLRDLLQRRVTLNDTIAQLDQQLNTMAGPARVNAFVATQRNELVVQRNQVVTNYNGLIDQIKLLQSSQETDPKVRNQIEAELSRRRESFIEAVLDLRQQVDAATKTYTELAQNDEVKGALDALGRMSKSKPKLGPSSQFLTNVKLLEKIEKSVITDSAELHKEGGVFWVNVTFNGKVTKPMVFDTGASLTTIPAGLAAEMGLKPSPSDPVVHCETADGTVVEARQKTIPSMRVGRFTINNVLCAVMPADRGNVAPLLGQSFHRHFTYKFTPESGHLVMSRVESPDQPQPKAARSSKNSVKGKRTTKSKATPGGTRTGNAPDTNSPD
jgi:clan AA aspartic protease (TIGR02281 family)